ncbi:MAG: UDP-3-O-acyl-N-acetylglucosamine deacetylase [Chlamydiia bacterium]|nr:UDP-3-O-acyl-N-acetylglucosamine deacetylase [Chlamydiia bacterium]
MLETIDRVLVDKVVRKEQTLGASVDFTGIGLHTGKPVTLVFRPAPPGTGVVFRRVDLSGCPEIPASVSYVVETERNTTIGFEGIKIYTVEHVLAALKAFNVDNVWIDLDNIEPPVGNGSSDIFVQMIEEAGVEVQKGEMAARSLPHPVVYSDGEIHVVALPHPTFKVSYTLHYPHSEALKTQYFSLEVTQESFVKELSPCRTFALYEEIEFLIDRGLICGGSLDNAVVIKDDVVLSKGGLFFPNEMVRHKILDLIGDLSLVGIPFNAHIVAIRSGHRTNVALAKRIQEVLS